MDLFFLALEDVLSIHADQISRYGGSQGLRDIGLLESAVAMAQAQFEGQFVHRDIFEMAAAYLFCQGARKCSHSGARQTQPV